MKTLLTVTYLLFISGVCLAQVSAQGDTLFLLNNEKVLGKVTKVSEIEIEYSFSGESLVNTISKSRVKEIHFGNGRVQQITNLVKINGEEDWYKVQLTTIPSDVLGLVRKGEVNGKVWASTMADITEIKKKAEMKVKKQAAAMGCHIVFIQVYNTTAPQAFKTEGKVNISGVGYGYK